MDDITSALYNRNLKTTKFVLKLTRGVYALPDRDIEDIHGIIPMTWNNPSRYVIIKKKQEQNFICSCGENPYGNCIHIVAGKEFISRDEMVDDTLLDTDSIYPVVALQEQSTLEPGRLWGVYSSSDASFGVIRKTPKTVVCLCCTNNNSCCHKKTYTVLTPENYIHVPKTSITKHDIEYPLSKERALVLRAYKTCKRKYPSHLIPEYSKSFKCNHGHPFAPGCPKKNKWLSVRKSYIHLKHITIETNVYYRPVQNNPDNCDCKMEFQGQKQCIFNLNNTHLFCYSLLIDILHNIKANNMPIQACFRSVNRSRIFNRELPLSADMSHNLLCAYKAFKKCLVMSPQIV